MDINSKSTAAESLPTGRIYIDSDKVPSINIPISEPITLKDILDRVITLEKENEKLKELIMVTMSLTGLIDQVFRDEPKRRNALLKYMEDAGLPIPCEVKFGEDKVTVKRIQEEGE